MINKSKNVNLQLTISKQASAKLLDIQNELIKNTGFNLSKSQTIEYLINKYDENQIKSANNELFKSETKDQAKQETSAKINALKDKLNVSYTKLAELIGIPLTTLKKYAYQKQEPTGTNKDLIIRALKKYDIK